ncbi:MAG TPA: farnesyl diphosphate synthase [Longimicrobiales bacterium]|nr:farnesyl diphosphate synthase [Longimicrobiales bacterium]
MVPPPDVQQRLRSWRTAVDRTLLALGDEVGGMDPVASALRYALDTGGKRLRPILCLAAADAVRAERPDDEARLRVAAAIELVHTYSLVHDDLPCMDDDDLRRGRPTPHRVFGTQPAMAAGFALIPHACGILSTAARQLGLDDRACAAAVGELCRGAGAAGMVGGQVLDLEAEGIDLDVAGLREIHAMKTAALFCAALRIGGIVAGAGPAALAALGGFGQRLGLAFQITDDVLDVTTDARILGKTPGKDAGAAKATFASALGVESARRAAAAEAAAATETLYGAGISSPVLTALAEFAVGRDR